MKNNLKVAIVSATFLLGGTLAVASQDTKSTSDQLISTCTGGGYPVTVCEIINGKRVCHKQCPEYYPKG